MSLVKFARDHNATITIYYDINSDSFQYTFKYNNHNWGWIYQVKYDEMLCNNTIELDDTLICDMALHYLEEQKFNEKERRK